MSIILAVSFFVNVVLLVFAAKVQRGTFGVMGKAIGALSLRVLELGFIPVGIIAFDLRKVHEFILVFGYDNTTTLVRQFVKMRYGRRDFIFQKGGDEFVIFVLFPGSRSVELVVERMVRNMAKITDEMTIEQRTCLRELTGGLVDRLSASIAYVSSTRKPYSASLSAMDAANAQKTGEITGDRATSGLPGTIISEVK